MRRFLFLASALIIIASCETKPNGEELVLNYLQENTNGTDYSIVEISEPDSLYSPGALITSKMLKTSERYAELSKQLTEAYNKQTLKERKAAAEEVAKLAYEEYCNTEGTDIIAHALTNKNFDEKPANRLGYRVKYKVDGQLCEDVFYLEKDNSAIGETASGMLARYYEYCNLNGKLYELKTEAEQMAKTMR